MLCRALLQAMAKRHTRRPAHVHRGGTPEDEAVDRLAGQLHGHGQVRREEPLAIEKHGMVGREAQAAWQLHQLQAAAVHWRACEADDLSLSSTWGQHTAALHELRQLALGPTHQLNERAPIHAACKGIMVRGHAHRCCRTWGMGPAPRAGGWLRRGKLAEDVVRLIAQDREQFAAVALDTWIFEVVADLQLVGKHDRWQIVNAPTPIPILAAYGLCRLTLDVLQEGLHLLRIGGRRCLDRFRNTRDELQAIVHVVALPVDDVPHLQQGLDKLAAAHVLLD
mmetsp:Transcript_115948/g.322894  ORF Transcript_115948/g.322894 Transcript_115948/m.322894 type:complete len:280 (+) Transcript_115948:444-1283(+)